MLSAGSVLRLIREGRLTTRTELARETELSRSTLAERIQSLLALGLVQENGDGPSTGGRPPATLCFNERAGVVLAADLDECSCRIAVCDLAAKPLAEAKLAFDASAPPESVLEGIHARAQALLDELGLSHEDVRGLGVGLPAPIDVTRGEAVEPRLLPAWDGFSIPGWFASHYDVPVLVDKHANVMALGEHWTHWREAEHLFYVTIGRTIDCGIVHGREIHHGARGAAGDIGHIRLAGHDDVICRCGNTGCLEAVAGGDALAGIVTHARAGDPKALLALRDAGRAVGEVLAECINFFNPDVIVVGGELADSPQQLLAGVREVTIARSTPSATRHLRMSAGRLGVRAGVIGAAVMVIEHVLSPASVDRAVQRITH
jgi:predicted NBD/HSP70 family sugar kinase